MATTPKKGRLILVKATMRNIKVKGTNVIKKRVPVKGHFAHAKPKKRP